MLDAVQHNSTIFLPPLLHVALNPCQGGPGGHQQHQEGGWGQCDQTRVPRGARCRVAHCPTAVAELVTVVRAVAVGLALDVGRSLGGAAPTCYLSLWKNWMIVPPLSKIVQYRILCLNCDLISDFKCRFLKSLNYNCPGHVMKFAEEVLTYFWWSSKKTPKLHFPLAISFHHNKVSHSMRNHHHS